MTSKAGGLNKIGVSGFENFLHWISLVHSAIFIGPSAFTVYCPCRVNEGEWAAWPVGSNNSFTMKLPSGTKVTAPSAPDAKHVGRCPHRSEATLIESLQPYRHRWRSLRRLFRLGHEPEFTADGLKGARMGAQIESGGIGQVVDIRDRHELVPLCRVRAKRECVVINGRAAAP